MPTFALPPLTVLGSGLLLKDALPEQVAFHWDASGRPDGQVPTWPLFWGCVVLSITILVLGMLARFIPSGDQQDTRRLAYGAVTRWVTPSERLENPGRDENPRP